MRFTRMICVGLAVLMLVVQAALAREVTIRLNNGQTRSGEYLGEADGSVRIRLANGREERIPRSQISRIEEKLSIEEQYDKWRGEVREDDYKARVDIAYKLYRIQSAERPKALELALKEAESILADKPDYDEAKTLRFVVADAIRKLKDEPAPQPAPAEPGEAPPPPQTPGEPRKLTAAEINKLKVFEVNLDARPTVVVPEEVIKELMEKYRSDPVDPAMAPFMGREGEQRFRRLEGFQQLGVMFDLRARELYEKVLVRTEPDSLRTFRTQVNRTYLVNYCGKCHGDHDPAPGFRVLTRAADREEVAYANLMILATTQINGLPLIMKDDPLRSPLIQMGLPREASAIPHPETPKWRPLFRNSSDNRISTIVDWMRSLYDHPSKVLPDYNPDGAPPEEEKPDPLAAE